MENCKSSRSKKTSSLSVETLYRSSLPCYSNAGGFVVDDEFDGFSSKRKKKNDNFSDEDEDTDQPDFGASGGFFGSNFCPDGGLTCLDCSKPFQTSYLLVYFAHAVCDACKNNEEKHKLITRTDAKNEFLLKDCDLDVRKPRLKFLSKKNPHNPRWGDMKLYLKLQVEKRAMDIWGSLEKLEEAKLDRDQNKEDLKRKRFDKKIKELRKHVRNDLYKKPLNSHQHEYGEEIFDQSDQSFFRTCKTCDQKYVYEKL